MYQKGVPALAIKDQLRHSDIRTTFNFYFGAYVNYQREQIEKLTFNSGKLVGNDGPQQVPTVASA